MSKQPWIATDMDKHAQATVERLWWEVGALEASDELDALP
jgi:hypothetical protein